MSNQVKTIPATKVITGKVRFSYANVWEPKAPVEGAQPKFSVSLIIPKSDTATLAKIDKALRAAYEEGLPKLRATTKNVPTFEAIAKPIHDGDVEKPDDPAYANAYYISANSLTAPGIVDAACNPILDHSEVYSGVYGRASINFYVYANGVNKGIACGLNNLQKLSDGEPLGSKASPESDFGGDGDGFLD